MAIHSTAIIDATSNLDSSVEVGPYAVILGNVNIGPNTIIGPHAVIGPNTTIGSNNQIYFHAAVGGDPQDKKFNQNNQTYLEIGNDNVIREFATLNRATEEGGVTRFGNNGLMMAYSHVAHNCEVGHNVIMANSVALAGHVVVGNNAIIGGLTGVHQFCKIGKFSIIGGCSKVVQDVPPYVVSDGNPSIVRGINSIGLKRNSFDRKLILDIKKAYQILFRDHKNLSLGVCELEKSDLSSQVIEDFVSFIQASERGIGF